MGDMRKYVLDDGRQQKCNFASKHVCLARTFSVDVGRSYNVCGQSSSFKDSLCAVCKMEFFIRFI